jgi:hypothetical protein
VSKAEWVSLALLVLISVFNALSEHYSTKQGVAKWLLCIAELLSILRSKGVDGLFKLPLQSVAPGEQKRPPSKLAVILPVLFVASCSLTPTQRLEKVYQAAQAAGSVAAPGFRATCAALATDCTDKGISDPKLCPKYQSCFKARRAVNAALTAVHVAVVEGLGLAALGDKDGALAKLVAATTALSDAWSLLKTSGAIQNVSGLFDAEVK